MASVYIGLGSNLGNRETNINQAVDLLRGNCGISVEKVSSFIETEAVSEFKQPKFINAVVKIKTELNPLVLLELLQDIEIKLGRVKVKKNGPRPIDLDILLYDDVELNNEFLTIPHPRMFERFFVLKPLLEVEPHIFDNPLVKLHKEEIIRKLIDA